MVVVAGLTLILEPLPTEVPPHEFSYHCHEAPVPRVPPEILNKLRPPGHMLLTEGIIVFAELELSSMFIVTLAQLVVLQEPSALA